VTQLVSAAILWLHNVATIVFVGYYVVLSIIALPALSRISPEMSGLIISALSKRSRPWLYASLLVFAVTGTVLLLTNPSYLGVGQIRNLWSVAMLAKHILVTAMIAMGFWFNAIMHVGPLASSNTGKAQAIARFRTYANVMMAAGLAVLLVTALAQAQ